MASDPESFQFDLPIRGRPADVALAETWYPGVRDYWPRCTSQRKVHPIDGIKAVVIHATAGGSSAGAVSVMRDGVASFHWLVPDEDEPQHGELVWACAPETLAAWHVRNAVSHPQVNDGAKGVNHWALGIEIVNRQSGGDEFSEWQVWMTAQIVRYCWAKYPNLRHVVSHAKLDPARRSDPGTHFPWSAFKKLVLKSEEPAPFAALVGKAVRAQKVVRGDAKACCQG